MASWFTGIAQLEGKGRHWHHTCCDQQSQCWRNKVEDAEVHAQERAKHLGVKQRVRWSTRRHTWVIENAKPKGA